MSKETKQKTTQKKSRKTEKKKVKLYVPFYFKGMKLNLPGKDNYEIVTWKQVDSKTKYLLPETSHLLFRAILSYDYVKKSNFLYRHPFEYYLEKWVEAKKQFKRRTLIVTEEAYRNGTLI